ncbi:uncharacterized protein LOC133755256 [Lepus europaeus]|uniref:uncharacterized protein LOC133755256 n=1 Tax=Lepus europaeus TaxID=9983 RepID=UPI002B4A30CB|nr:uncharacterized protein LOC133755256 [Lepus europaeus]
MAPGASPLLLRRPHRRLPICVCGTLQCMALMGLWLPRGLGAPRGPRRPRAPLQGLLGPRGRGAAAEEDSRRAPELSDPAAPAPRWHLHHAAAGCEPVGAYAAAEPRRLPCTSRPPAVSDISGHRKSRPPPLGPQLQRKALTLSQHHANFPGAFAVSTLSIMVISILNGLPRSLLGRAPVNHGSPWRHLMDLKHILINSTLKINSLNEGSGTRGRLALQTL